MKERNKMRKYFIAASLAVALYFGAGYTPKAVADGGPLPLCPPGGPITKQCPCPDLDPFCPGKTIIGLSMLTM